MATPKIAIVPCWERQFVSEQEAIGLLNITRPEWLQYIKPRATVLLGNNYDMDQLTRIMLKQVHISASKYIG